MNSCLKLAAVALIGVLLISAFGCVSRSTHTASSVVQFLYPDRTEPMETPGMTRLNLPIRVGIAFVPETSGRSLFLTENDKIELMREVARHFQDYDFVRGIEIIPSAYLTPKGSFQNLDQVRRMFNVDVITLISFDQTQFVDQSLASITYWTLVGAYIVPADQNTTHTLLDAAVYDIASRKMLFRAPGVSRIKSQTALYKSDQQLRQDSLKGFQEASRDLIVNLDEQLALFKHRVKTEPQEFQVVQRSGARGGGSVDILGLGLLLGLGGWRLWTCRKKPS